MSQEEGWDGFQSPGKRISLDRQSGTSFLLKKVILELTQFPRFSSGDMSWSPNLKRTVPDVPNLYTSILMTGS